VVVVVWIKKIIVIVFSASYAGSYTQVRSEDYKKFFKTYFLLALDVFVCVCVCERERERDREEGSSKCIVRPVFVMTFPCKVALSKKEGD
jgi:hypothetical protein